MNNETSRRNNHYKQKTLYAYIEHVSTIDGLLENFCEWSRINSDNDKNMHHIATSVLNIIMMISSATGICVYVHQAVNNFPETHRVIRCYAEPL